MTKPRYKVLGERVITWAAYYANGTVKRPGDIVEDGVQALTIVSERADGKDFAEMHYGEGVAKITYDIPDGPTVRGGPLLPDKQWDSLLERIQDDADTRSF